MSWDSPIIYLLYALWVVIALLVLKLLVTRKRWRHPLRGSGPMLFALLLSLVNTEVARGRTIQDAHENTPPPYWPSVAVSYVVTLLILYWLWRQLELIPRWLRQHLLRRREARRVETTTGDDMFATGDRVRLPGRGGVLGRVVGAQTPDGKAYVRLDSGSACTFDVSELESVDAVQTKEWPPRGIETK